MKRLNQLFLILSILLFAACASKVATITEEDVEKLRVDYNKGDLNTIEDLMAIYKDPTQPIETRIAVLQVMAETRHPDALKLIHDFMAQGVGLNYALLTATASALINNPTPENIDAMVAGLVSAQKKYIEFRTGVMAKLENAEITTQVEQLLNLYQTEKENYALMQESLTRVLGSAADDKVVPILINIAKDKTVSLSVRSLALEILGKRQHPLITQTFIEMLGDPESQRQIRNFALQAIGDIKQADVILALLETFNSGKEDYFKLTEILARALGDFSDPAVVPALVEITQNREFPLKTRKDALSALIKFNDPEIFKQLLPMMEDPQNYVLFDEMTAMATALGDPEAFEDLRRKAFQAQQKAMVTP
ncbi:MAG TPA: HEAT repeat domain-containing protein [Candidatus Marinimicrobia bacterium]|nr:HEAT repeat domain-containing protein [Candidatus Neomarinimicrobiota bacterium]